MNISKEIRPKIQSENERRKRIAEKIIIDFFQNANIKEVLEFIAKKKNVSVENLNENDHEYAHTVVSVYHRDRQLLIDEVLVTQIPIEDIEEFTRNILQISSKLYAGSASPEETRNLVIVPLSLEESKQYLEFINQWSNKHIGEDINEIDPEMKMKKLRLAQNLIINISGVNRFPRPQTMEGSVRAQVFKQFDQLYSFLFTEENLDPGLFNALKFGIDKLAIDKQKPNEAQIFFEMAIYVIKNESVDIAKKFLEIISRYGFHFGLDEPKRIGLMNNLLPAIRDNKDDIQILIQGRNIWGMNEGNFGVADFICHCYAQTVTPENISELIIASREAPTTSLSRLEQNRKDALSISIPFGALRDFIHDQRPGVHTLVNLMVTYYDAPQNEKDKVEKKIRQETVKNGGYLAGMRTEVILDLSKYDQEVMEDFQGQKMTVKAIDILRRIEKNTEPVVETTPVTNHQEINDSLNKINRVEFLGKITIEQASLTEAIKTFCDFLETMMDKKAIGIEPSTILALSWLERRVFEFLQNMSFETQIGAYKTEWFKQILRFSELTSSYGSFNKQEFIGFIGELHQKTPSEAYRFIGQRIITNVSELAGKYKDKPGEYRMGALWSGNVTHELINLVDWKPSETILGSRIRKEMSSPEEERLRGD